MTRAGRRSGLLGAAVPVLIAAAALFAPRALLAQDRTILVGSVVQPDGTIAADRAVIIAGGKIEKVVAADQANAGAKDRVVRFAAGAVISPGLIDLRSGAGAREDTVERLQAVDPALSALDAINPGDRAFEGALRAGITAVMVTPAETNIVSGVAATVRTHSSSRGADVLRGDGPMIFALGNSVLDVNRGPTSRAGALAMLRDALAGAKKGDKATRLGRVLSKELDALVVCEGAEDVDAAVRTFSEHGVKPNLVLGDLALETAEDLAGSDIGVVVGPLTFNSARRELLGPARLAKAELRVAFAGRSPYLEATGLRVTAALAVRYGMDPAAARRACTGNAARIAGVSDRVGSIEGGKEADIAVFSADPLRLDARVLEVYIKGVRVYAPPASASEGSWEDVSETEGGADHGTHR